MNRLFCLFMCLMATALSAQPPATLPDAWMGDWYGTLEIFNLAGPVSNVGMELHIEAAETKGEYEWELVYVPEDTSQEIDRRPYLLVGKNDQPGHFVMDERNSIYLDAYLFQDVLTTHFRVDQSLLTITYVQMGDSMRFEVIAGSNQYSQISGDTLAYEIESFRISNYQKATLYKR